MLGWWKGSGRKLGTWHAARSRRGHVNCLHERLQETSQKARQRACPPINSDGISSPDRPAQVTANVSTHVRALDNYFTVALQRMYRPHPLVPGVVHQIPNSSAPSAADASPVRKVARSKCSQCPARRGEDEVQVKASFSFPGFLRSDEWFV